MSTRNTKNKILTSEERNHVYDHMYHNNDIEYNFIKASEELQELSLILTQRINKGSKVPLQDIINEVGDVKIRLEILERMLSKDPIEKRINKKLIQFQHFIETNKHKNI